MSFVTRTVNVQFLRCSRTKVVRCSNPLIQMRNFSSSTIQQKSDSPKDVSKLLSNFDLLGMASQPANNIETVLKDGIQFSNGIIIKSPNDKNQEIGSILLGGEAFELNLSGDKGQEPLYEITNNFLVKISEKALGIFKVSYPKPELVVVGLGKKSRILHESNRKFFTGLGIQVEISDTRNACQNFDLLATERPNQIAALLLPPNL